MNLQQILAQQYEQLEAATSEVRIILLHPESLYRSALVAYFLRFARRPVYYYAIAQDDVDIHTFINSLLREMSHQHLTFGRYLSVMTQGRPAASGAPDLPLIAEALAKELSELSGENYYFIIDEFDRCDASDEIHSFFEHLIDHLPSTCHLIINSRTFPRLSWVARIASKHALIFSDLGVVYREFYTPASSEHSKRIRLDVRSLGPGFVLLDDLPVASWDGNLPRLLLFFVLEKPAASRSEICAALWPELDDEQAVNIFHVTKRRLHKALKGQSKSFQILAHHRDRGHYSVDEKAVALSHDAREFAAALLQARFHPSNERADWLNRAIEIYRGPYLQGHDSDWILRRRKDYEEGFIEALTALAEIHEAEQRPDIALQYRLRAAGTAPDRLDLHRSVIQTYLKLERRSEAIAYLNRLSTAEFVRNLNLPSTFVQEQRLLID